MNQVMRRRREEYVNRGAKAGATANILLTNILVNV